MKSYTVTLVYSYELSQRVANYYTWRQFGKTSTGILIGLICIVGIACWFDAFLFVELIGALLAVFLMLYFIRRHQVRRGWLEALEAMGKPEATLVVDEESLSVTSGAGSATFPWKCFSDVWKQTDYWLLFIGKRTQPMTIPLTGVNPEILKLIDEKVLRPKNAG